MKFAVGHGNINDQEINYFIGVEPDVLVDQLDKTIASIIRIPLAEYRHILKRYNSYARYDGEFMFKYELDCQNAANYLNEKYGILINLIN